MKEIEVINKSINSVTQMRSAIFLPYNKVKNTNLYHMFKENANQIIIFENEDFRLEVMDHLLTQIHRDILDVIFYDNIYALEGDRACTYFSINSLLKKLNCNNGQTDRKWIIKRLEELKRSNFKIISKRYIFKGYKLFSICDEAVFSEKLNKYLLVFSTGYLSLMYDDILIDYSNYLPDILNIKSDTVKAFIRYILSHDWINHSLDYILIQIAINPSNMSIRSYQKIKKTIKEFDFSLFGIVVTNNHVRYNKLKDIYFYNAKKEIKKRTNIPCNMNQYPSIENNYEPISHIKRTNIPVKTRPP